jgi:YfiH family protein
VGLGSNDERENILKNRDIIAKKMNARFFCTVSQCHSSDVEVLSASYNSLPWDLSSPPKADAIVCTQKDILIGVLSADCGTVIFADKTANIIAVAHAGWRGAMGGILQNTVLKMIDCGSSPSNIIAVQGATIAVDSYEVGSEFYDNFVNKSPLNKKYFIDSNKLKGAKKATTETGLKKYYFDLSNYISDILQSLDLKYVGNLNLDTYANEDLFYSYRRSSHRSEIDYARQVSVIKL